MKTACLLLAFIAASAFAAAPQIFRKDVLPGAAVTAPAKTAFTRTITPEYFTSGTLTMWVRPEGWSNNDRAWHFFCKAESDGSAAIMLYRFADGKTRLLFKKNNGNATDIITEVPFASGEWLHLAFTWQVDDAKKVTELKFYVNGLPAGTRKAPVTLSDFPTTWTIGDKPSWNPQSQFSTTIGRTELHAKVLSAAEISGIAGQRFRNGKMSVDNNKFTPKSTNTIRGETAPGAKKLQITYFDEVDTPTVVTLPCEVKNGKFSAELQIPEDTVNTRITLLKSDGTSPVWKITDIKYANFLPDFRPDFWQSTWIWHQEYSGKPMRRYFRKTFDADPDKLSLAALQWVCDGGSEIFINGTPVLRHGNWAVPTVRDNLLPLLKKGKNVIAVEGYKISGAAGIFGELSLVGKDSSIRKIGTDKTWKATAELHPNWTAVDFNDSGWAEPKELMRPPQAPYGDTPYRNFAPVPQLKRDGAVQQITAAAGSSCPLEFAFEPTSKLPPAKVYIKLLRKNAELFRTEAKFSLENGKLILRGKIDIPSGAMDDVYEVKLDCLSVKYPDTLATLQVRAIPATNKPLITKLERIDGVLQFTMNGKPAPLMLYRNAINFRDSTFLNTFISGFDRAGVRLTEVNISLRRLWHEDGSLNTDMLDLYMLSPLYYAPNSNFVLFFHVDAPAWMMQKYPGERYVKDNGEPLNQMSYASEIYTRETADFLKKIIAYLKTKPYYNRIAGFGLDGGEDGQFMQWTGRPIMYFGDYSQPMKDKYHRHLAEKYVTIDKLNTAWQSNYKSFADIKTPEVSRRRGNVEKLFLDPVKDADLIEFNRVFGTAPADFMLSCAQALKEASNREKITAAYYGKFFSIAGYMEYAEMAVGKVLRSPDIDYLIAVEYSLRGSGKPHSISAPAESYALHNKMFVDEADIRTFLSGSKRWAYAGSCFETVSQIRKMFAFTFVRGHGIHWYDLHGGVFENKAIHDAIGRTRQIAQKQIHQKATPAEIAFIVDEESFFHTTSAIKRASSASLLHLQNGALGRIGAPFDIYFASDLDKMPEYKMYIFADLYAPTPETIARINQLKRDGKMLIFTGSTAIANIGDAAENLASITGIKVKKLDKVVPAVLKFIPQNAPAPFDTISAGQYISGGRIHPLMLPVDPPAQLFGTLTADESVKTLAYRDFGTHKVFFSAIPALTPDIYRTLAKLANVHIISHDNNTMIYAGRNMLGVHTSQCGNKKLFWHKKATFTDAVTGKVYARNTQVLTLPMLENETKILEVK